MCRSALMRTGGGVFILFLMLTLAGCGGVTGSSSNGGGGNGAGPSSGAGDITSINHIIFMAQENRSFDTYFGQLNAYRASLGLPQNVDGIPPNATSLSADGKGLVSAFHLQTMCIDNTSASWAESHADFNPFDPSSNTPLMNGFVQTAAGDAIFAGLADTLGLRAMGYYDGSQLPYHYFMASMFGTSDRWFAAAPVETEPNRIFMLAATTHGHAHAPSSSINIPNIFSLLEAKGISWKVYVTDAAAGTILNYIQPFASAHASHIVPVTQYFTDLQNGTLPAVALIEPGYLSGRDEHPGATNHIQVGTAYTAQLMNGLMSSSSWKDSVFILTFDEAGGLYDHVAPPTNVPSPDGIPPQDLLASDPKGDFTRYGFRLPLMVVSPFSKKNYVSHTVTDFTSILKLIETRFGLANLTARDAAASDMTEYFDFVNVPWAVPPTPPAQPTNGPCYNTLP